jgi:hypothetical protein
MRSAALLGMMLLASCSGEPEDAIERDITSFVKIVSSSHDADQGATFTRAVDALGLQRSGDSLSATGTTGRHRMELFLRRSVMPMGPRAWITWSIRGDTNAVEAALRAELGKPSGRGFGDEDGWLLSGGGLILERWTARIDLTFSPGPAQDALEDLARAHLPSLASVEERLRRAGWRLMPPAGPSSSVERRRVMPPSAGSHSPEYRLIYAPSAARLLALSIEDATADGTGTDGFLTAAGVPEVRDAVAEATRRIAPPGPAAGCVAEGNFFVVAQRTGPTSPVRVRVWRRPFAQWNTSIQQTCTASRAQ